jgi:hypothetical protein
MDTGAAVVPVLASVSRSQGVRTGPGCGPDPDGRLAEPGVRPVRHVTGSRGLPPESQVGHFPKEEPNLLKNQKKTLPPEPAVPVSEAAL